MLSWETDSDSAVKSSSFKTREINGITTVFTKKNKF